MCEGCVYFIPDAGGINGGEQIGGGAVINGPQCGFLQTFRDCFYQTLSKPYGAESVL